MPSGRDGPFAPMPTRPSLEQLRKQAKAHLKALRASTSDAKLADAQTALAREYGFRSWPQLVLHVETVNPWGLKPYQSLADDVALAYSTGNSDAIRDINWRLGTQFSSYRGSERMHAQLPIWTASPDPAFDLAVVDARLLVARQMGFESWANLAESLKSLPRKTPMRSPEDVFYRIDRATKTLHVRGPLSQSHWETVAAVIRSEELTGLNGSPDDDAMDVLAGLARLTRLHVEGPLSDRGMRAIARMTQLEDFAGGGPRSSITDKGLTALARLKRLRRVRFPWAPGISDKGVAHLAACERLERVDFLGAPVGDGLIHAMEGKTALRVLKAGRLTTDAGLVSLRNIPAFVSGKDEDADLALMDVEAEPHLLLDGPITDAGLTALTGLHGLRGISFFWHTGQLTSRGIAVLSQLPQLRFLGCEGRLCDDEAMRFIAAIPKLQMLMAQGTVATDAGFEALSRSQTIESIWGRECPNLHGRGFAALASMPRLRNLGVSCKNVDDAALANLSAFRALQWLMPMDFTDEGFRHIGRCLQLERLTCMYCPNAGDDGTAHLRDLQNLRTYYSSQPLITDSSLGVLANLERLEKLEFRNTDQITDAGVLKLAKLPKLEKLSLHGLPKVSRAALSGLPDHIEITWEG